MYMPKLLVPEMSHMSPAYWAMISIHIMNIIMGVVGPALFYWVCKIFFKRLTRYLDRIVTAIEYLPAALEQVDLMWESHVSSQPEAAKIFENRMKAKAANAGA